MQTATINFISQFCGFFFWLLIAIHHPMRGYAHLCQSMACSLEMTALSIGIFIHATLLVQRMAEWLLMMNIEYEDQEEENDQEEEENDRDAEKSDDETEKSDDEDDDSDFQPDEEGEETEEDDSYEVGDLSSPERTPEMKKAIEDELRQRNLIPSKKND